MLIEATLCLSLLLLPATQALAWSPRLSVDDDIWLQVGLLAQLRYEVGVPRETGDLLQQEIYTRRARLLFRGAIHPNISFFFASDVPNTGVPGVASETVWNAAFAEIGVRPELRIKVGRILVPFSVENRSSSTSLLGIDYNLNAIKLPAMVGRSAWRDEGLEARGLLLDGRLDYRVAVLQGRRFADVEAAGHVLDGSRLPRLTGMLMVNLADSQPGVFFDTNSLGALDLLSFGGGVDYLPSRTAALDDSLAFSVFGLLEQPLLGGRLNAYVGWYQWRGPGWVRDFEGSTVSAQLGYLLPGTILGGGVQPVVRYQAQRDPGADFSRDTFNVGVSYLVREHMLNLKLDYAVNDRWLDGEARDVVRLQTQLRF